MSGGRAGEWFGEGSCLHSACCAACIGGWNPATCVLQAFIFRFGMSAGKLALQCTTMGQIGLKVCT
jgi:hypothetical protein